MTDEHSTEEARLVDLLISHRFKREDEETEWQVCACGETVWDHREHLAEVIEREYVAPRIHWASNSIVPKEKP